MFTVVERSAFLLLVNVTEHLVEFVILDGRRDKASAKSAHIIGHIYQQYGKKN